MNQNLSWVMVGVSLAIILGLEYFAHIPGFLIPYFAVVTFALSIFVILKSCDNTVYSMEDYSKKTKLPPFLIGFVILAVVTALKDTFTGVFASKTGQGALILGDVLTAVLVDAVLLVGLVAIIMKKLPLKDPELKSSTLWIILAAATLPLLCFLDHELSQVEAILMLTVLGFYIIYITRKEVKVSHIAKSVAFKSIWKDIFIFGVNTTTLILGAKYMIESAQIITAGFHISSYIIGFIFVAFGNSLAEIIFTLKMAFHGVSDMGLGNSFGSILTNILLVWGVSALVSPLKVTTLFIASYAGLLAILGLVILLVRRNVYLTRKHGIILLAIYLIFTIANIVWG
jgi:cation:H+ antiporter